MAGEPSIDRPLEAITDTHSEEDVKPFHCTVPRILFGQGRLEELGSLAAKFGQKAFLTIDPYLHETGQSDRVGTLLREVSVDLVTYAEIEPNPDCAIVDRAATIARDASCSLVIAFGGGSAIDFGKGVAVMASNPGTCWQYTRRRDHTPLVPNEDTLPVIAIPTTAGTGSEMTPYAVFTHSRLREKSSIVNDRIIPRVALIDPELTYSCPSRLTALTGVDVLAHAIEAYVNIQASPFAKMVAREAIQLVSGHLRTAVKDSSDREARNAMAWASALAGIAISHSNPTLPHALGQAVGGYTHAPHGGSVAACLTAVMRLSVSADIRGFADIAHAMDPSVRSLPVEKQAERSVLLVETLLNDIDVRVRFRDFGLKEEDIERVTEIALTGYFTGISLHPKPVGPEEIRQIYMQCL
jgi:alcohol dehydrogenase class IV